MEKQPDPTIGRLVAEVSRDLSALVQAEIQLAKKELSFSVKAGGIGAGMFLAAGFLAVLMTILAAFSLAYGLAHWVGSAWAFLIVAGLCLVLAGITVAVGIVLIKKVKAPTHTIETAKEIPATFKH